MRLTQSQIDRIRWHIDPDWPVSVHVDVDPEVVVEILLKALEQAWSENNENEKRIDAATLALRGEFV